MGTGAPWGTVTFLFTDVEGSTRLWQQAGAAMRSALERHDVILRAAIDAHGGYVFATGGDGFAAAFARADDAVAAALEAQGMFGGEPWPDGRRFARARVDDRDLPRQDRRAHARPSGSAT